VHHNEAFIERLLVFGMESTPEDGVVFTDSYPTGAKKDFALCIELPLVVDDVGFVSHAHLGILGGKVDEFLF